MVYIGLGSNVGDRAGFITAALDRLDAHSAIRLDAISSLYKTEPYGVKEQRDFINAAARLETKLTPSELLGVCQSVENSLGRKRTVKWGPRTIDIDILLYDGVICETAELTLPHPYLTRRRFVLLPLYEISGCAKIVANLTAGQLLAQCDDDGKVSVWRKIR